MKKLIFSVAVFIYSSCIFAAQEVFSVDYVGVDIHSKVLFVGVSPASTSSTCSRPNEFKWNLVDEGVKDIHSLALMAQATGKKFMIGVWDGKVCVKDQPTGWWVRVEN